MSAGHVCKACGTQGRPTLRSPSNFGVELLVWLGAIIVAAMSHWIVVLGALAFSLWRFRRPQARVREVRQPGRHPPRHAARPPDLGGAKSPPRLNATLGS